MVTPDVFVSPRNQFRDVILRDHYNGRMRRRLA